MLHCLLLIMFCVFTPQRCVWSRSFIHHTKALFSDELLVSTFLRNINSGSLTLFSRDSWQCPSVYLLSMMNNAGSGYSRVQLSECKLSWQLNLFCEKAEKKFGLFSSQNFELTVVNCTKNKCIEVSTLTCSSFYSYQ